MRTAALRIGKGARARGSSATAAALPVELLLSDRRRDGRSEHSQPHPPPQAIAAATRSYHATAHRPYHATVRKPALPIIIGGIGLAVAATAAQYVVRASRRMKQDGDPDYDDDEEEDDEADEKGGSEQAESSSFWDDLGFGGATSTAGEAKANGSRANAVDYTSVDVMGLDLGTSNLRLACTQGASGQPCEVSSGAGATRHYPPMKHTTAAAAATTTTTPPPPP